MALSYMYANHITAEDGEYEPQRQCNGILSIDGVTNDDILQLALESFTLPKVSNNVVETGYLNEKRKYAGQALVEDFNVVYKDFVDKDTAKILWDWREKVYDPKSGKVGKAKKYKKSATIELVGPNNEDSRYWTLEGVWPSSLDMGEIDMSSDDMVKITMTLACDKVYRGQSGSSGGGDGNIFDTISDVADTIADTSNTISDLSSSISDIAG